MLFYLFLLVHGELWTIVVVPSQWELLVVESSKVLKASEMHPV